jgi:hypothetical protein
LEPTPLLRALLARAVEVLIGRVKVVYFVAVGFGTDGEIQSKIARILLFLTP